MEGITEAVAEPGQPSVRPEERNERKDSPGRRDPAPSDDESEGRSLEEAGYGYGV